MATVRTPPDPWSVSLFTMPADPRQKRLALGTTVVSILLFLVAAPFARVALPQLPAFIPMYQSALVTCDLVTAVLLLGQYSYLRAPALLVLASGYLFSAFMAVAHLLSFPGLFAPTGALGAGSQTTAWLYFIWHGGFPLFILAYLHLKALGPQGRNASGGAGASADWRILGTIAVPLALCVLSALWTTVGHDTLPVIMRGNRDDTRKQLVAVATWTLSLVVLLRLWRQPGATVLDLWLQVTLVAWLLDVAMAAVLNGARFDLGFYAGRVYGLLASSFVLMVLLLENGRLYADLAEANARERQRNAELEKARHAADQATQAKSDFLAAMSHEIRTPMNGVIGMIDVLARSSLKSHQVAMADLIRESAHSLLTIIDDILDFSKIEAGRLDLESEPLSISDSVEKVCAMLNRLAEKQRVELTLFTDPQIPPRVLGDGLRLRQVLINLVNNAIKFSGGNTVSGRVAVRAVLAKVSAEQVDIEFQIIDDGIGMSQATVAGLFSAFNQADVSTTRRFGGTGLGLAISANLVRLMGGRIDVQSQLGAGSCFTVRLPFAVSEGPAATPGVSPVDGLSCLLVGNGETRSGDLAAYLTNAGARITPVRNLDALEQLATTLAPGLWVWIINTAMEMPVSLERLREIARRNPAADTRFVVIAHGPIRYPRQIDADRVSVDGNVLTRDALLRAVALAAGRAGHDDEPAAEPPLSASQFPAALSREDARRQGRLILVVEDNEINQKVIRQQMALLGFTADLTSDGEQALAQWRSGDYALVITDLHMPVMDGYQLAAAIREDEAMRSLAQRTPIVALTANTLKSESLRCKAAGMDDYMSKPLPLSELQAFLEKWLPAGTESTTASTPVTQEVTQPVFARWDVQVLSAMVGNDPQVIADFLRDYLASSRHSARNIRKAQLAADGVALARAAHQLKSAARAVGAMALGELCQELERAGTAGRLDALASVSVLDHFEAEMLAVEDEISALLSAPGDTLWPWLEPER